MRGISFIVRVRNEEATLNDCLRSLLQLEIPYEIHVILNRCTDRSHEIAKTIQDEGVPLTIHTYDHEISRAGYENLITDMWSPHSMVEYSRWALSLGTLDWRFRWDSDFIASDGLIAYLNSKEWTAPEDPTSIAIRYVSPDVSNEEPYLFSGTYHYTKYIFWEYCEMQGNVKKLRAPTEAFIHHKSQLSETKSYWKEPSWFWTHGSEEAGILRYRYHSVLDICGSEPEAQARASNPESANIFCLVRDKESELYNRGVYFWQ
jgi:glycosyltransferase involved in cell wall biosynthesis